MLKSKNILKNLKIGSFFLLCINIQKSKADYFNQFFAPCLAEYCNSSWRTEFLKDENSFKNVMKNLNPRLKTKVKDNLALIKGISFSAYDYSRNDYDENDLLAIFEGIKNSKEQAIQFSYIDGSLKVFQDGEKFFSCTLNSSSENLQTLENALKSSGNSSVGSSGAALSVHSSGAALTVHGSGADLSQARSRRSVSPENRGGNEIEDSLNANVLDLKDLKVNLNSSSVNFEELLNKLKDLNENIPDTSNESEDLQSKASKLKSDINAFVLEITQKEETKAREVLSKEESLEMEKNESSFKSEVLRISLAEAKKAKKAAEAQAKKAEEENARLKAEESARLKEENARLKAEAEEQKRKEEKAAEEEAAKLKAQLAEEVRKRAEAEDARKKAEEEVTEVRRASLDGDERAPLTGSGSNNYGSTETSPGSDKPANQKNTGSLNSESGLRNRTGSQSAPKPAAKPAANRSRKDSGSSTDSDQTCPCIVA